MDIPDIPVQTPVSLTFLINSNNVTIYYNGKMRNIYTFKGKPVMNRGPLYFHAPKSSLLAIIDSLLGDSWREVYEYAQNSNLQFLSFGDSMYIDLDKCKI